MEVKDLIVAASGATANGRTKAGFGLYHEVFYSDNTSKQVGELLIEKPVLSLFSHVGYVQVDFKYSSPNDMDLLSQWQFLEDFSRPENSVYYSDEELEQGFFVRDGVQHPLAFPALTLSIIPLEYKGVYCMLGRNPIFYTLQPNHPKGEPATIRMIFRKEDFTFLEVNPEAVDEETLLQEAEAEIAQPQSRA